MGDTCPPQATEQARALQGYAVASVLGWRAFGLINLKQLKARHPSTNPYDPYRIFDDSRFTILKPITTTILSLLSSI